MKKTSIQKILVVIALLIIAPFVYFVQASIENNKVSTTIVSKQIVTEDQTQEKVSDIGYVSNISNINEGNNGEISSIEQPSKRIGEIETIHQENANRIDELKSKVLNKEIAKDKEKSVIINRGGYISRRQMSESLSLKTEMLDWWMEVNKLFTIDSTALLIDVETGKNFKIKRTFGTNHADCETLTAEDTKVMQEIWGGEWSWSRRAVIIVANGHVIAASSNGMPHAGRDNEPTESIIDNRSADFGTGINLDKVKNNEMDGHFCVHFLNSKTHGTDRVDETHQEMICKALKFKYN
jgi:hypothetical protein